MLGKMRTGVAITLLLGASIAAQAAGLGRLSVNSALGQVLAAEIELLSLQPGEFEVLSARVASPEAYRDAKIEYTSALRLLRFSVEKRAGGQPYVKVTSIAPINEPFLDVLIEVTWPSGRLQREYPILLDPPGFNDARAAATPARPAATPAAPVASAPPSPPAATTPAVTGTPSAKAEMAAPKFVEYMGGEAAILAKAKVDFDKGEYRWIAEALKHVVFANPKNVEAKGLLADTYEQLGYQAESGPWRSVYLQGAFELRNGVPNAGGINTASPDTIKALTPVMLFEYLSVRLNGPKASGKKIALNVNCTDLKKQYALVVENAVLNHFLKPVDKADATISMTKATLDSIQLKEITIEQAITSGALKIDGRKEAFGEFLALLDTFPFWFNVVTP